MGENALIQRLLFFRGGPHLRLVVVPQWAENDMIQVALIAFLLLLLGWMTRWWPDKKWPFYTWAGAFIASLVGLALRWPWLWWLYLSQVAVVILWNILLWFRGPDGRDDD